MTNNKNLLSLIALLLTAALFPSSIAFAAQSGPQARPQPTAQPPVVPRFVPPRPAEGQATRTASPPKSQAKPAAAKAPAKAAAKKGSSSRAEDPDSLRASLETFAKGCITSMNRQRMPGISNKEVSRRPDGTFQARYMAIDPDSLSVSYNPTNNNKVIKYIGRMEYHEVEYVSSGKDRKQALAGPFSETNRMPVTELIKFKGGKWSY